MKKNGKCVAIKDANDLLLLKIKIPEQQKKKGSTIYTHTYTHVWHQPCPSLPIKITPSRGHHRPLGIEEDIKNDSAKY